MSERSGVYLYIPGRDTLNAGVKGDCTEEDKRGRGGTFFGRSSDYGSSVT